MTLLLLLLWKMFQSLNNLYDFLLALFQSVHVFSTGEARTGHRTLMGCHQWWEGVTSIERKNHSPVPAVYIVAEWPQDAVGLLYHKCTLLVYVQLFAHQEHQDLFWTFQLAGSSMCLCIGLLLCRFRTSCLSLLIFVSLIMIFYLHISHSWKSSAKTLLFICDKSHGPSRKIASITCCVPFLDGLGSGFYV